MVILKTEAEVEVMCEAGRRLAGILDALVREVRPGVAADFFDTLARQLILEAGSKPAFLGYNPGGAGNPFPAALCVSVNDTVVHGVPSRYVLREGDILKLDIGLIYKGWYSDMAVTVGVGKISPEARRLMRATEEALEAGIREAVLGKTIGDIGFAIEEHVRKNRFSIVESLSGHGIGRDLHEDPNVFNFGKRGGGQKLKEGMVLAIEPMVAMGSGKVRVLPDDSYVTADGSPAAHFERTIAVTVNGPRMLTQ